jgi:hypothetical protein
VRLRDREPGRGCEQREVAERSLPSPDEREHEEVEARFGHGRPLAEHGLDDEHARAAEPLEYAYGGSVGPAVEDLRQDVHVRGRNRVDEHVASDDREPLFGCDWGHDLRQVEERPPQMRVRREHGAKERAGAAADVDDVLDA